MTRSSRFLRRHWSGGLFAAVTLVASVTTLYPLLSGGR